MNPYERIVMFIRRPEEHPLLRSAIDDVLTKMSITSPDTDEYRVMSETVTTLLGAEDCTTSKRRVSPDTWAVIAANLFGIAMVIHFEKTGIITTKAMSFAAKLK
jgi:hypothetical protein